MSKPLLLLVDDAPDLGLVVALLGRRAGCEVACRTDVPGAWEFLGHNRPDLILLDRNLPGVSGLELCRRVRATPALADLPIALFVQPQLTGDVAAGLEAGVDFLFSKELVGSPDHWRRRLAEILAQPRGRHPGPSVGCHPPAACQQTPAGTGAAASWAATLNRALHHPSLRQVGPEVTRILLRRALPEAFGDQLPGADPDAWLLPGGGALDASRIPASVRPGAVGRLASALADQLARLLGAEASAPFRSAVAALGRMKDEG